MRYLVVVEKGPSSYGAYVPDLPGCVAAGESREEVLSLIREAIALSLRGIEGTGSTHFGSCLHKRSRRSRSRITTF